MKKVSIITPCHNSAVFIHRLLDSILSQSYEEVEMIAVDNDSKDETAKILNQYSEKFQKKGYSLSYIHQDDLGPSCAVKKAIKLITGDYLIVPDSDDFFAVSDFLKKMVTTLESLPDDYGMIRCQEQKISDGNFEKIGIMGEGLPSEDPGTLFTDCLLSHNKYYYPGVGYLYKVAALKKTIKNLEIFGAYHTGQNRQLMLPVLYSYKCYTIPEPMVNYLVRPNSISNGDYKKYSIKAEMYNRAAIYIDSILDSIVAMPSDKRTYYRNLYLKINAQSMASLAIRTKRLKESEKYISDYRMYGGSIILLRLRLWKEYLRFIKQIIWKN